jgi:hypothetical protein
MEQENVYNIRKVERNPEVPLETAVFKAAQTGNPGENLRRIF